MWSSISIRSPGAKRGFAPPAAFVMMKRAHAQREQRAHRAHDRRRAVPLVQMVASLQRDDRRALEPAGGDDAAVPLDGRRREARHRRERQSHGVLDRVGERTEPGAEHEADRGRRHARAERAARCAAAPVTADAVRAPSPRAAPCASPDSVRHHVLSPDRIRSACRRSSPS
jgi:hypothetical protein